MRWEDERRGRPPPINLMTGKGPIPIIHIPHLCHRRLSTYSPIAETVARREKAIISVEKNFSKDLQLEPISKEKRNGFVGDIKLEEYIIISSISIALGRLSFDCGSGKREERERKRKGVPTYGIGLGSCYLPSRRYGST